VGVWSSKVSQIAFSYNFQKGGAMTKDGTTLPATTRNPKKKRSPAGEEKKVHFDSDAIYQTEKENILRDTFSSQFSESFLPAP